MGRALTRPGRKASISVNQNTQHWRCSVDQNGMLVPALSAVYGLIFGSFLNVVIHRVPKGESVSKPRSRCPDCEAEIAWHDNVPVFSWLRLGGKCRQCSVRISPRYPAVELITAAGFVAMALSIGAKWVLPAYLLFAAVLVTLSAIDIDTRTIPNRILYPAGFTGALLLVAGGLLDADAVALAWAAAGGVLGFAILFTIWFVAPGGMGYGDVRLAGYLGMHLGYLSLGHVALGLFAGFLFGAMSGVVLLLGARRDRKTKIPFGPYLAMGAVVAVVFGDPLIDAYLGL